MTVDLTLWLLVVSPVILLVAQLLPRRVLIVLMGYASGVFNRVAYFNAIPLFSVLGGLITWTRVRRLPPSRNLRALASALVFGGLAALLAALWSVNGVEAFTTSLRWLALAPLVLVAFDVVTEEGVSGVSRMLMWLSPFAVIQAATTVFFRVSPSTEDAYYQSAPARFLLGDAATALFTPAGWNNVRELERAGGIFFVSVNRAALVMGVMFLLYLGLWLYTKKFLPLVVACFTAVAIVAGGSKTGLLLIVIMPVFALIAAAVSRSKNAASRLVVLLVALVVAAVGLQIFLNTADDFVTASETTLLPRYVLWGEAVRAITENPLAGLGFGGWLTRWDGGQVAADFLYRPAHNWLLQAWLDGGVVFGAANVVLVIVVIRLMLDSLRTAPTLRDARFIALSASAFLWSFIHGTLDNTPIFGDPQASAFLAIAGAVMIALGMPARGETEPEIAHPAAGVGPRTGTRAENGHFSRGA